MYLQWFQQVTGDDVIPVFNWSNAFVRRQLQMVMFADDPLHGSAKKRAQAAVRKLADFKGNKSHDRHIDRDECRAIGLNVDDIELDDELQDLVLTVHHCYMHSLMNTPTFKIIENHLGAALAKQQITSVTQQ
jgi:hypothetical protein